jgi:GTP-binding protein HflX
MSAVREVLAEIGAADVPEIVVINKADAADPVEVKVLEAKERDCVVVSARTGLGIEDLLTAVDARLPRREHEVRVLVPYGRGDLVARAHQEGEVLAVRHAAEGTELTARVPPDLAAELTGVAGAPVAAGRNATD